MNVPSACNCERPTSVICSSSPSATTRPDWKMSISASGGRSFLPLIFIGGKSLDLASDILKRRAPDWGVWQENSKIANLKCMLPLESAKQPWVKARLLGAFSANAMPIIDDDIVILGSTRNNSMAIHALRTPAVRMEATQNRGFGARISGMESSANCRSQIRLPNREY